MLKRRRKQLAKRDGTAAVEAAFCLPFVITLTLFTIEICGALFLKESLTIAAYEGARIGVMRGSTTDEAQQRGAVIMTARGISGGNATAWGVDNDDTVVSDITTLDALETVTVRTSAPLATNSFFIGSYLAGNRTVTAEVSMRREFDD